MRTVDAFPYAGLPAQQNWRSAVSAVDDRRTIDPQGTVKFRLARSAKIASAGSCFAQRLALRLRELGLDYVVAERGGEPYSARYGDVYTSRQLVQLLERALGRFDPLERAWTAPGGYLDPFRPGAAGTFSTVAELETDRRAHLAAVRDMFAAVDVFLFTLGLTELWCDRRDEAAFPTCPGRGRGVFDPERHVWRNLDVGSVTADLERFIALLREVNPAAKLILTVSPVPNAATMMPLHIVRASMRSKSVLKVAAEEVAARHDHVDYFASYDVFTQNLGGERMFGGDGRQPFDAIADRVMSFFMRDFFGEDIAVAAPARAGGRPCDEDVLLDLIAAEDARRAPETSPAFARGAQNGRVEQVAHLVPLYFAGDSNALVFRDRVFAVPGSDTPYLGRTLFTPGLTAFDVCDTDGRINQNLLAGLVGENLLMADGTGSWTAYEPVGTVPLNFVQDIAGRVRRNPPILLFCGVFDWLQFLEEIRAREVALPPELAPDDTPPAADALDFDAAATIASRYLAPLERGLHVLQSYGLRNLCLHSLQPPTADDEMFARTFFPASARARYRSLALMNHLMRGICERTGTAFVDLWPLVTGADGAVDSQYCFDAVHLNLDAALLSVGLLLETLSARAPEKARLAEPPPPEDRSDEAATMIDDIVNPAQLRLGGGWQPVERNGGDLFRWAGDDAMLYVPVFAPVDHRLSVELEPGPGVGSKPFTLEIYDGSDTRLAAVLVRSRQTADVTLPASPPAMHSLRLHVVDGGRHFAGDERVLDYRAFRVTVVPQRADVVSSIDGFRVGAGWYQLEEYGGSTFRWVNNDAGVEISSSSAELALEVEPGPGVGKQPFTLEAIDPRGAVLASFVVGARERIIIPLPPGEPVPYSIKLRVTGGGRTTIGDSRILNFRAFQSR